MSSVNIHAENVTFGYEKGIDVLKNISFYASAHESIGLIGANGVGKSTLLKLFVGLNLGFSGEISVSGRTVRKENLSDIRSQIGYVFQNSDNQLFMPTTFEDVAFAPRNYGLPEKEVEQRVTYALEKVGIDHLRSKQIYKMSGGEKKMVSIATILSMTPDIILMDEPSIGLDPRNRRHLIQILNELSCLKIIASHDLDMILDTCERTILMADGKIICDRATMDILTNQELLEQYGLELPFCLQKAPVQHSNKKIM